MKMFVSFGLSIALCFASALRGVRTANIPVPLERGISTPDISSEPVHIDLTVWRRGRIELQWSGNVAVGSPPQNFNVVFDTGAPFLVLPGSNCTMCGHHPLFDPSNSSTFSNQPGIRLEGVFAGSSGDTLPPTDGQGANCTVVTDTVHIVDRNAPQQQFLLCDVYSQPLAEQLADGIFGLSSTHNFTFGPWSNFQTAYGNLVRSGELRQPEFGFSYVETKDRAGRLTLGGTDRSLYIPRTLKTIPLDWPLSEGRASWVVGVHAARIGDALLANSSNSVTLVDTGAAVVITPDFDTTRDLYALMSNQIQPMGDRTWGAPCHVLDSVVEDVTFTFGGDTAGQQVEVKIDKRFVNVGEYPGKPGICQGVFLDPVRPAREPLHGRRAWIIGSPLLRSYYTVWNGETGTLGFARPSC
ncbi:Aspartic peptidase domain-containing protein [Madurella fahalii]|uniref:Aspartic peptidase domain-containing protein n=1 Tax=Madurella fahalii TaxID=1157608 RepID=A0ABQ0GI95_9PEZI